MHGARRLAASALAIGVSGIFLALGSCSSNDSAPAPASEGGEAAVVTPRSDAGPFDAGIDVVRPPPTIPGCVGAPIALQVAGERGYVAVNVGYEAGVADAQADVDAGPGQYSGTFLIDFGSNGSTIDFGGFAPPGPAPSTCAGDAAAPGASCSFVGFDFFGDWGTVQLTTADYSFLATFPRQSGIIGTDFLSVYPFTLDYYGKRILKSEPSTFCTEAQLLASGFAPLPATGFYTKTVANLRPLSDVITDPDAATAGFSVPNIPTVPITVAGVSALAQLDTGYDDRIIRHSVNVNEALLAAITKANPQLLIRDAAKDLYLTTCVPGISQQAMAYHLQSSVTVEFIAQGGSVARREANPTLFVKQRLAEVASCGGIETWTVPAAQLGASFMVDAQAVIFDPVASRVWVPKN